MLSMTPSCYFQGHFGNSTKANGDNISYKAYPQKGTYTLQVRFAYKGDDRGIVDIDIDAAEVGSYDLYNAATSYNPLYKVTGINIATSGLKTIRFRLDGKNGASSNYALATQLITLWITPIDEFQ